LEVGKYELGFKIFPLFWSCTKYKLNHILLDFSGF